MKEPNPTFTGPCGQAWKYNIPELVKALGCEGKPHAGVASWVVRAPWANMAWHSYALHLIHLRPLPGFKPPVIYLPGATHEIILFALDPDWKVNFCQRPRHLMPSNFGAQFVADSDAAAEARCEACVWKILNGELSPDTDYTQHWIALFFASMIKGDPARAGETRIRLEWPDGTVDEMVVDPAPVGQKPKVGGN